MTTTHDFDWGDSKFSDEAKAAIIAGLEIAVDKAIDDYYAKKRERQKEELDRFCDEYISLVENQTKIIND